MVGRPIQEVFLSYRRDDAVDEVERIHLALIKRFGPDHVFLDKEHLERFRPTIEQHIARAEAVVFVIGQHWLRPVPKRGEVDWVIQEVQWALRNPNAKVYPVLVNGAKYPKPIPQMISGFAEWSAYDLRSAAFDADLTAFITKIETKLQPLTLDNLARMRSLSVEQVHGQSVGCLFWAGEETIISGGDGGQIAWWTSDKKIIRQEHMGPVRALGIGPTGKRLLSVANDSFITWSKQHAKLLTHAELQVDDLQEVAIEGRLERLAMGSTKKDIEIVDLFNFELTGKIKNTKGASCLCFSAVEPCLAAGFAFGKVELFDPMTHRKLATVTNHKKYVSAVALGQGSLPLLASAGEDELRITDFAGASHCRIPLRGRVSKMAFSPDASLLAFIQDGVVSIVGIKQQQIHEPPEQTVANDILFTPDETRLIAGLVSGKVQVWGVPKR